MERNNIIPPLNFKTMTKEDAILAMLGGKKVTHRHFGPEEWATMENGRIVLEDNVHCCPEEFWKWRRDPSYDNDWSIYIE